MGMDVEWTTLPLALTCWTVNSVRAEATSFPTTASLAQKPTAWYRVEVTTCVK